MTPTFALWNAFSISSSLDHFTWTWYSYIGFTFRKRWVPMATKGASSNSVSLIMFTIELGRGWSSLQLQLCVKLWGQGTEKILHSDRMNKYNDQRIWLEMAFKHPTWHHGNNIQNIVLKPLWRHVYNVKKIEPPRLCLFIKNVSDDEVYIWNWFDSNNYYFAFQYPSKWIRRHALYNGYIYIYI